MKTQRYIPFVLMAFSLTACGGSGGSSSGGTSPGEPSPADPINVALAANGGTASASYNEEIAHLVNDGESVHLNEANNEHLLDYWQGNIPGDSVTVTFNREYLLTEFTIYTNMAQQVNNNPERGWIALSENGSDFEVFNPRQQCTRWTWYGMYRQRCEFDEPVRVKAIRVSADVENNAHNFHVAEVEAMGY